MQKLGLAKAEGRQRFWHCTGELWTDAENQTTMHQLLAEFYNAALSSLERQINNAKESAEHPESKLLASQLPCF